MSHKPQSIFEAAYKVLSGESQELKEAYNPSRYYRAVEENLNRLLVLLNPKGQLAKEIEREADNVESEFWRMREKVEAALDIWEDDIKYTIGMSAAAENEVDDMDPSDFDESADLEKSTKLTEQSVTLSPQVQKMAVDSIADLIFSIEDLIEETGMDPEEAISEWIEQMDLDVYELVVPVLRKHFGVTESSCGSRKKKD